MRIKQLLIIIAASAVMLGSAKMTLAQNANSNQRPEEIIAAELKRLEVETATDGGSPCFNMMALRGLITNKEFQDGVGTVGKGLAPVVLAAILGMAILMLIPAILLSALLVVAIRYFWIKANKGGKK